MKKIYKLTEQPSIVSEGQKVLRLPFMLISEDRTKHLKQKVKFPIGTLFQLRHDLDVFYENNYLVIDVLKYSLPRKEKQYYVIHKDVLKKNCAEVSYTDLQRYYASQKLVKDYHSLIALLREFVRISQYKDFSNMHAALLHLHFGSSHIKNDLRITTDDFHLEYDCDEKERLYVLTILTKEFELMHNSEGLVFLQNKITDEQIDNIDNKTSLEQGSAFNNYKQNEDKYVQWMNQLGTFLSSHTDMNVDDFLKTSKIVAGCSSQRIKTYRRFVR